VKQSLLKTDRFFSILDTILSTLDINELLTTVVKEIQSILKADRCTLYLIDWGNNELYSKVLQADNLVEIRIPIKKNSLSGYSAIARKIINVKDAYDDSELKAIDNGLDFDRKWDEKSGYRTKSVLVVPVPLEARSTVIGVFQALNKPGGFTDSDVNIMGQLSYFLNIAVNNALLFQAIEEEKMLKEYIIDDIDEGICILDIKKKVISANKSLQVMFGSRCPVGSMIGEYFFELFPNFNNTLLSEKIDEVHRSGIKKVAVLEVLEVKIIPYFDDNGKVRGLVLIFKSTFKGRI